MTKDLFLTVLEAEKSKIKASIDFVSSEYSTFWFIDGHLFL
jgi:hypothetical protein